MITLYIPYQTIVNGLSIMIIVSKQITEKDRLREIPTADDDHSENICISLCVCVNYYFFFFPFYSKSVDGIRKRMRTGGLYERKHIDNC